MNMLSRDHTVISEQIIQPSIETGRHIESVVSPPLNVLGNCSTSAVTTWEYWLEC